MVKINFDVKKHKLENGLEVITVKKRIDYAELRMLEEEKWWHVNMTEKDLDEFVKKLLKGRNNGWRKIWCIDK